jgi:hypothetical protein
MPRTTSRRVTAGRRGSRRAVRTYV